MNSSGQNVSSDLDKKIEKINQKILTVIHIMILLCNLMETGFDLSKRHDPVKDHSKVDFPRMREGGEDASFSQSLFQQGKRTPEGNFRAQERANTLFRFDLCRAWAVSRRCRLAVSLLMLIIKETGQAGDLYR